MAWMGRNADIKDGDLPDGEAVLKDVNMKESVSQPFVVRTTNIHFFTCDGKSTYVLPFEGNGDAIVFNIISNVLNIDKNFDVPFKTFTDIEDLMNGIEMGKHEAVWSTMTEDRRKDVMDSMFTKWKRLMDENPSVASNMGNTDHVDKTSAPSHESLIVQSVDINTKSTSYAGVAGASTKDQPKVNSNFCPLVADLVFDGVNISILRKVVEMVSTHFEQTLYGYFIGKRMAFLVVEYYARNNWAKHGLKRIIMNTKGFFFFIFDTRAGLEAVWRVSLDDTSSFARCLFEVNSEADLVDVVTIGISSLTGDDFTKETICVELMMVSKRWVKRRKGRVNQKSTNGGQLAGPSVKQFFRYEPKAATSTPKKGATNVGNASKSSSMLKTVGTSSKNDNITTSNSYSALNEEEDEKEDVEDVYDETANLFSNTKPMEVHLSRLLLLIVCWDGGYRKSRMINEGSVLNDGQSVVEGVRRRFIEKVKYLRCGGGNSQLGCSARLEGHLDFRKQKLKTSDVADVCQAYSDLCSRNRYTDLYAARATTTFSPTVCSISNKNNQPVYNLLVNSTLTHTEVVDHSGPFLLNLCKRTVGSLHLIPTTGEASTSKRVRYPPTRGHTIKLLSTPKKVYNRKLSYTKQSGSSEYCTWIGTFTLTVDPMSTPETTPADRWIYPSNTILKMLSPTKSPQVSCRLLI
nr:zinc knuckle CX2CX4HX4C [Tanacetum cinerariifolium]